MAKNTTYTVPLLALRGKYVYPDTAAIFDAGRDVSVNAVREAEARDKIICLCVQREILKDEVTPADLYEVGTLCRIEKTTKVNASTLRVTVLGLKRVKILDASNNGTAFGCTCAELKSVKGDPVIEEAYFRIAKNLMREIFQLDGKGSADALAALDKFKDAEPYVYNAISFLQLKDDEKQKLLEETNVNERLKYFESCLNNELEISKVQRRLGTMVRKSIDKNQKDYYLREQLKAIHTELGDDEEESDALSEAIKAKHMPAEVEAKALKELARLDKISPASPEYFNIRTYVDWLCDLPWNEATADTERLADAVKILNDDHYGLDKIKSRITEYLAVLKLTKNMNAPVLCFVGPPGVGKTSIAKSIARSLGRKFVSMSLGGVRDEAEIRGHRRTYIGSMPGRIIYAMKNAGSINPVFLFDEVDKIASDYRGDPASALLEVLDPEQNKFFRDGYLEVPYDLSKVLFITTANTVDTIPAPLIDRMEVIELSGYTREEKLEIAERYLIPKQIMANGLSDLIIRFERDAVGEIIDGYTLEAGVRSLEREIGAVARKVAVKTADESDISLSVITAENVEEYLGVRRYKREHAALEGDQIGAATGLAWTSVGGTTLTIEVSTMQGKGEIQLTGKLGDVMKESARAAISYIRSHADEYDIATTAFSTTDIHIHVPEGATPKDGPSAGITMATAILSAFTNKPVKKDVAMTGEITLRGKVLPIGGLKEKALAAYRVGIKNLIIPADNEKDLEEVPESVRKDINVICVEDVGTVFRNAISGL